MSLAAATELDESAVSSPPIVTRCVTSERLERLDDGAIDSSDLVGLSRAVPRIEPPSKMDARDILDGERPRPRRVSPAPAT